MRNFEQTAFISPDSEARAAGVTQGHGRKKLCELVKANRVSPDRTASGRIQLTPVDARIFWEALHKPPPKRQLGSA